MLPLNHVNMSAVQSALATCPSVEGLKQLELLRKAVRAQEQPSTVADTENLLHNPVILNPSAPSLFVMGIRKSERKAANGCKSV